MLSGKEKAQLLVSLLEEKSEQVLSVLEPSLAKELTALLGDAPVLEGEELTVFLDETLKKIERIEEESAEDPIMGDDLLSEEPEEDPLDSLDDLEEEVEELAVEEAVGSRYPDNYRSPERVAELLQEEHVQMAAFFLAHCEENLKADIYENLEADFVEEIETIKIENIPISDQIYKKMFETMVIKKEGEDAESEEGSSEEDGFDF